MSNKSLLIWIVLIVILIGAILKSMFSSSIEEKFSSKIAKIDIKGEILSSEEVLAKIDLVRNNPSYKGVIIRLNSPGGAVAPSQEIYQEILKLRKTGIPVVASINSLGASGAYYIASACDSIVANPGSLVGSIGVIMSMPYLKELYNKIGIDYTTIKAGKMKDVGNPMKKISPEQEKYLHKLVNTAHEQFINDVAIGRNMPVDSVRKYADGRVFNGSTALKYGLVDKLGNLYDAVDLCRYMAGVGVDAKLSPIEDKKEFLDEVFSRIESHINIKSLYEKSLFMYEMYLN